MKWSLLAALAALAVIPATVSAKPAPPFEVLYIGNFAQVDDPSPTTWAISGYEMIPLKASDGHWTPIMRSEQFDARLVEILSRAQAPPLRAKDIRTEMVNGRNFIVVRRYMLAEVKPQDARAEHTSTSALAQRWARRTASAIPQIQPAPSRFGF